MQTLVQSPTDPAFVQNPYPFYDRARALGPFFHWQDYGLTCATSAAAVNAILRDRRFGREIPPEKRAPIPDRLAPFYAVEAHSMLELEPPRHTRLRSLVLRAFTSRRIAALEPDIRQLSQELITAFPAGPFDLLPAFAQQIPVIIIARLLGVPEDMAPTCCVGPMPWWACTWLAARARRKIAPLPQPKPSSPSCAPMSTSAAPSRPMT